MPAILCFPLYGPSRRAEVPVIEIRLDRRDSAFPGQCPGRNEVNRRLAMVGVSALPFYPLDLVASERVGPRFAGLLGQLAIHLQRHAGHPVRHLVVRQSRFANWRILVLVEHAHAEVGMAAVQLAVKLLGPKMAAFSQQHSAYLDFARSRAPNPRLLAIAEAAEKRGVPYQFLSRPPLEHAIQGADSRSDRGLLQLGQGVRRQLVIGSVGPDRTDRSEESGESVALAEVDARFPEPGAASIPLIAVTGTNGKTTTTRMIAHILDCAGYRTGVTTSEGVRLSGTTLTEGDSSSFEGHSRVLTDGGVDAAVLETHHRGIVVAGFAWRCCDVGVCLNVTEDHIAPGEIESLEEMADVKAAVPERASGAAILFADDPYCRAMAPRLKAASTWWVSLHQPAPELLALGGAGEIMACTLEREHGKETIVVHRKAERRTLLCVDWIPATFGGAARFMVSNAMHAACAALALGMSEQQVIDALTDFEAGERLTPGRLNEIHGFPFRLILDFAHNPDGMARLVEFNDRLRVPGRKLLALSGMGKRPDIINGNTAQAAAGHFDHYFCKEYTPSNPPLAREVAPVMQAALVEAGVDPKAVSVLSYGKEVFFEILSQCEPGDLLVYLIGNAEKAVMGDYIDEYRQRRL